MPYSHEFLNKITAVGTLGYSLEKIINVLDIEDSKQFTIDFDNKESDVAKAFQKGVDKADYIIDLKLYELAKTGDLEAIKEYERKKHVQLQKENKDREYRNF